MKTRLLPAIFLLVPILLSAQKYTLHGILQDTAKTPLESATVMLLNPKDSALLFFGRSQSGGVFEFKNLAAGDYLLRATYFGYDNLQVPVSAAGTAPVVELGTLQMSVKNNVLGEVQITGAANPVTIKNDTIEYNAGSFKVKDNALVEDLLKKMPGIEVQRDGTVKAQGEAVKNVLVDGKKFFGSDPKIATQNLPADAVNKVQVFDKKSDQATFSGVDDGQREKTINLDLKEDKKNGWFGQIAAGAGNDLHETPADFRYEGRASINRFKPKQQISLLGMGNNVNQAGFSIDDYMAFSGAMRQMMSGGGGGVRLQFNADDNNGIPLDFGQNDGFLKTWAGGVNFDQEYGKKYTGDLNTSYFYSQSDRDYLRATERTSFLPNGNFNTAEQSNENKVADNHRLNLTLDQKIDSSNSVQLTSALAYSQTQNTTAIGAQTLDDAGQPLNDGQRRYASDATGSNWTGGLLFRHKFAKKGRNFTTNLTTGINHSTAESSSFSQNRFFNDASQAFRTDTTDQAQSFKNDVFTLGAKATYTEPLGKRRYLEFTYGYNLADNRADKQVYDMLAGERNYNPALSNAYTSRYDYHRAGLGLRFNRKAWNGSAGLDAQTATLDGEVTSGQGQPIRQTFQNLLPRLDFNYEFSPSRRLRFGYNTDITAPTVQQLQPVPDVSDPLNIIEGNPGLKPEYTHSVEASFVQFDPETMRSFFSMLFLNYTQDRIVNAQFVDSLFVRHFQPVNVASDYRLSGHLSFGLPWKKIKSRFNTRSEATVNRGLNLINNTQNTTTGLVLTQNLSWEFTPAEWITLSAEAELSWNQTAYSIDKAFNQDYLRQTYTGELNLDLPKNWNLNTSLNLVSNSGLAQGYDQAIPIWNAGISKFFLKGKRGELTLGVRDLLNRNVGIRRTANLNYVEDVRTASLGRYVTLKFTYALNKMGGPGGGPGVRMMIRR